VQFVDTSDAPAGIRATVVCVDAIESRLRDPHSRRRFLQLAGCAAATATLAACGRSARKPPVPAATPGPIRLSYIPDSTNKVEQLIGDYDKQLGRPTVNQTESRYGVIGTDLGNSFEHQGRLYVLFGDTIAPGAPDPLAYSDSSDPEGPLQLDFLSDARGTFLPVSAPGISMGPFEVPVAGLSLNGTMYVVVKTNYALRPPAYTAVLTRFDERARSFSTVRELSRLPEGRFITMTLRLAPADLAGLPTAEPYVLAFGSGEYRRSNAYLAAVPAERFESGAGTCYFAGLDGAEPRWTEDEGAAAPIVSHPVIGDVSVQLVKQLGVWLMTYDSRYPQGILLRYANQPWGPWSDPIVIFNAQRDDAVGAYIHNPRLRPGDGLDGPVTAGRDPARVAGGAYAPYMIERFTQIQGKTLSLYYLMSTWNPYVAVGMRSKLTIAN
jgi:hypothetical protein